MQHIYFHGPPPISGLGRLNVEISTYKILTAELLLMSDQLAAEVAVYTTNIAGFEPTILATEGLQTYALDCLVTKQYNYPHKLRAMIYCSCYVTYSLCIYCVAVTPEQETFV